MNGENNVQISSECSRTEFGDHVVSKVRPGNSGMEETKHRELNGLKSA
jgi:hypothetical protein